MAVSISISITQNSQSVANNTSNVTVEVIAKWTNGSYNHLEKPGHVVIDGTKYFFASAFNINNTTSGTMRLYSKTVNVAHGSNGAKTLTCTASYTSGVSSGTVTASASKTLTTIPRKSTLTVSDGTLGTAQTLTIAEKTSSFKHKLKYACGSASGWILGDSGSFSTSNSVSWTPPISLASQNTTGTSVSVTFTLYTYTDGGSSVGSNTYVKTFAIPSSVKPSVSFTVTDSAGYASKFGGSYVQGLSKFQIVTTASGANGASIKTVKIEADGKTYTNSSVTTGAISGSGSLTIKVTVTDSRGRTATSSQSVSVLAYAVPKITALTATRSDASGNASSTGEYLAVKFSSSVSGLGNRNTATYKIQYKKATESSYTPVTLSDFAGQYSVTNGVYVIPADATSSYDITLTVTDALRYVNKVTTGSSVKKLWSLLKKAGKIVGIAIGKVAEEEGVLDIAYPLRLREGLKTDVLWSGTYYMTGGHTIQLSKTVDKQPTGIALVFSAYEDGAAVDNHFQTFFVPKEYVSLHSSTGFCVNLCTADFSYVGCKMLYISNTLITGSSNNNQTGTKNGITYANNHWVLRYVIGV